MKNIPVNDDDKIIIQDSGFPQLQKTTFLLYLSNEFYIPATGRFMKLLSIFTIQQKQRSNTMIMRNFYLLLSFIICLLLHQNLAGQNDQTSFPGLPLNPSKSVLFGKDIIIHDQPARDQKLVALCSAYNGWLYAAYTYQELPTLTAAITILKSIDGGISWSVLMDTNIGAPNTEFTCVDLITCGNNIANLKLFLALVYTSDPSYPPGGSLLVRYDGQTGAFEDQMISDGDYYDMALASDFIFPATSSNPGTLGVLFSKHSTHGDTLILRTSSNGGISLDSRQIVATTAKRFHKVSLAYGRCISYPSGRYFASWEEQENFTSSYGRIYTSYSEPHFNSPFTTQVRLDNLLSNDSSLCRNPSIACQYNNANNDSSNMTGIVLFEKHNPYLHKNDVIGYANLQIATSSHFQRFTLSDPSHQNLQPDINFNPYDSTFMVTYFDSTALGLPFLVKNINLENLNTWNVLSSGYNDSSNVSNPVPKVELNNDRQSGANVWIGNRTGGNGIAMFDAQYSTYTGVSKDNPQDAFLVKIYPNPCKSTLTVDLKTKRAGNISIDIYNLTGQLVKKIPEYSFIPEQHGLTIDVSELPVGMYLLSVNYNGTNIYKKFSIVR